MFERFTDRARGVLSYAQDEARRLHHDFIGTEHILLGLIHDGEGLAARALETLGITLDAAREKVEEIANRPNSSNAEKRPFTPRAKKVLEGALREALQLGHNYVGTEHLLLGITRQGEGAAVDVLASLGADLAHVRAEIVRLLSNNQSSDTDGANSPHCPRCGDPLEKTLRYRTVNATDETQAEQLPVTIVYCGTCRTALGWRE